MIIFAWFPPVFHRTRIFLCYSLSCFSPWQPSAKLAEVALAA
jgi:hypothetical protein